MSLNKKNRQIDELLILISITLLFILTVLVFEKTIPSNIETITGKVITTVNITPSASANCEIMLKEGLNLVSFFCIGMMTPSTSVIGSLSNLEAVFEYRENEADSWKSYNPNLPDFVIQDLNDMSRSEGYWIRMQSDEYFVLDGKLRLPSQINLEVGWNLVGYPNNEIRDINYSLASIDGNYTEVRSYNQETGSFINYIPGIGGSLNETEPGKGYWINMTIDEEWIIE